MGGDPLAGEPYVSTRADRTKEEIDCNLASLCLSDICTCGDWGCEPNELIYGRFSLWLRRSGEGLVGLFSGTVFGVGEPGRYVPAGVLRFERRVD
jgi:hypothetical protein